MVSQCKQTCGVNRTDMRRLHPSAHYCHMQALGHKPVRVRYIYAQRPNQTDQRHELCQAVERELQARQY